MRKCRKRIVIFLLILFIVSAALTALFSQIKPYILLAANNCVVNAASDQILKAIDAELSESQPDFSDFTIIEKDVSGNITAIRTNMAKMNVFKNRIMSRISQNVMDLDEKTLSIPLGSLFFPSYFGMRGPKLKTQIASLSTVDSTIDSEITEIGINQAQQTITVHVQMDLTILSPVGTQNVHVFSDVPVAQTVIVGTVPHTYLDTIR